MNFFDFFRRKKILNPVASAKVLLPDGKTASEQLAALLPSLEPTALPCLRLTANPLDDLFLFDSKFGGYPYWPADKPYPVDSNGQYMYLLAQINFSGAPLLEGYPVKGILQFYLSDDDMYGLNLDNPTEQAGFRVVYFEDTTAPALEHFHFLDRQQRDGGFPVSRQLGLSFSLDKDYYSFSDFRLRDEEVEELIVDAEPVKGKHALEDELTRLYPDGGHKMGGYSLFTQSDPRDDATAYNDYVLLLQMDSQLDDICWGDVGVGNFFIHPEDLRRKDFSQVLYNWDCT